MKGGRDGLVVRSRPRGRRVPCSKPDSTKEPSRKRVWCTLNPSGPNPLPPVWCGSLEGVPAQVSSSNYVLGPKIAFVLLQSGE
ncbi:hypothetical protein AVEN_55507-1 [Araneus ventricosus]|uniref:Uncharacterized protein n=1 Tax=Araneus ventricosus TaxID=182803 RepID=A0A4Y2CAD2_ARAVE|nr:hypothetical protein AVEN_55507-1 [Araneus ventricosus]